MDAYRDPLVSFPRLVVLDVLAAADLVCLGLGLMLLRLSKLGVEMRFKLVLDRDREPMKDVRCWYAARTCCSTFLGNGASRYTLRSGIGLPNFFS